MLPDFPTIKREIQNNFEEYIQKQSRSDGLVGSITQIFFHEGDKLVYHTVEGKKIETTFAQFQSKFDIANDELIKKGPEALISTANKVSSEIQKQLGRHIIAKLDEVTKETGNVVDGKGQKINPDLILEALEKIQIDFDDDGNPCMPAMFVGPDLAKRMVEKIPEWEKDVEHKKKHEALMKKKKEEWNDRESNRKLVD